MGGVLKSWLVVPHLGVGVGGGVDVSRLVCLGMKV